MTTHREPWGHLAEPWAPSILSQSTCQCDECADARRKAGLPAVVKSVDLLAPGAGDLLVRMLRRKSLSNAIGLALLYPAPGPNTLPRRELDSRRAGLRYRMEGMQS